jgi:phosphate transport system substrate-binding protein
MKKLFNLPTIPSVSFLSLRVAILALGLALLTGCPAGPGGENHQGSKLIIRGSNTLGEELTPQLIAEFKKAHPQVGFDLEFKGTTYGMGALMAERCDLAAASRPVSTNELALAKDRQIEFNDYPVGAYAVAIVVHPTNPIGNLTAAQVRDLFTGRIRNWKDIGGPDLPVHLCIRDPISGTYLGFQELAMDKEPYALDVKTLTSYEAIQQAVAQDAGAVGYTSVELAAQKSTKAMAINGVAPTIAQVQQGHYPYARPLRFYTTKARESSTAQDFVRFVQSAAGQKIVVDAGFVPR